MNEVKKIAYILREGLNFSLYINIFFIITSEYTRVVSALLYLYSCMELELYKMRAEFIVNFEYSISIHNLAKARKKQQQQQKMNECKPKKKLFFISFSSKY